MCSSDIWAKSGSRFRRSTRRLRSSNFNSLSLGRLSWMRTLSEDVTNGRPIMVHIGIRGQNELFRSWWVPCVEPDPCVRFINVRLNARWCKCSCSLCDHYTCGSLCCTWSYVLLGCTQKWPDLLNEVPWQVCGQSPFACPTPDHLLPFTRDICIIEKYEAGVVINGCPCVTARTVWGSLSVCLDHQRADEPPGCLSSGKA